MKMTEHAFELLDFYRLREEIAAFCVSEEGRDAFLRVLPSSDAAEIEMLKRLAGEWSAACVSERPPDFRTWRPVGACFPALRVKGAALSLEQVAALGGFCRSVQTFRSWAADGGGGKKEPPVCPSVSRRADVLPDLSRAGAAVFAVIGPDGGFRDLPRLAAIRDRIAAVRREIEHKTASFFSNPGTAAMLQSLLPALKNGRQVLAVKAQFRGRIRGIVHEVSQSGQTIYVEPEEIVERNNELIAEEFRLSREMTEILRELTASLKEFQDDFAAALEGMLFLDRIAAAARWGVAWRCVFARGLPCPSPSSLETENPLVIVKGRHPFLREAAVPIDISLPPGARAVIVTGPNAGGKTVALKTVALCALANQCGWPVPASEGTALPVFDYVGCDIGDDQSIDQSLSTFSAHMKNVAEIFENAGARSLILLDELGSGTDPHEGAAIAMAVLDGLIQRGSMLFVTTHHGAIKHYGYTHRGCVNASVEFDVETLAPTYRILMGVPGESRALDVAEKSGVPAEIISGAREYLSDGNADISALIQGLTEKYERLRTLEDKQKKEGAALSEMRRDADLRELRIRQAELLLREKEYRRLEDFFLENRRHLENLVREIREGNVTKETTVAVKKWGEGFDKKLAAEYEEINREKDALATLESAADGDALPGAVPVAGMIEPGVEVFISPGGRRGIVVRKDKKDSWIVAAGPVKISVREKALFLADKGRAAFPAAKGGGRAGAVIASGKTRGARTALENLPSVTVEIQAAETSERPVFELRLLGFRRAEAEKALIRQLDLAAMNGLQEFSVVHGKGDGILQDAVIAVLKNHPAVADFHFALPEHGGTGKTIVRMM